jgi:hypothetical protein
MLVSVLLREDIRTLRLHSSLRLSFQKNWLSDKTLVLPPVFDQVHGCSTPESPFEWDLHN